MTDARRVTDEPNPFAPPSNDQNNSFETVVSSGQVANNLSAANAELSRLRASANTQPPSSVKEAPPVVTDSVATVATAPVLVENDHRVLAVVGRSIGSAVADRLASKLWVMLVLIVAVVAAASFAGAFYYGQRVRQKKPSGI